jgi:hypothetical protein
MPKELQAILLAAGLTVLGTACMTTPASARDCAPGQSITRIAAYELLSMKVLGADRAPVANPDQPNGSCG